MKTKTKKIVLYIILAASVVILSLSLFSCGEEEKDTVNRESFSPKNGAYEIMLSPDDWSVENFEQLSYQLSLFNTPEGFILDIYSYNKSSLTDLGVSDLDSFIEFSKTLEFINGWYEPKENKTIGGLSDIAKKHRKNSVVTAGKRQEFYTNLNNSEYITEFIHLETGNYYLVTLYSTVKEKFGVTQKAVNDLIANIKTEN